MGKAKQRYSVRVGKQVMTSPNKKILTKTAKLFGQDKPKIRRIKNPYFA